MASAAASSLLAPLLSSPISHLEVLGRSSGLTWLALDGEALTVQWLPPDSPQALPTSLFLSPYDTDSGREISLRDGRLHLDGDQIQVHRWWRPRRASRVKEALAAPWHPVRGKPPVDLLLGRGAGLTPEGDDLLAGWLVAARSLGHAHFEAVRDQVLRAAKARTSAFSAALLRHAAEGYGVAPLIEYVDALAQPLPAARAAVLPASDSIGARAALLGVGHTSGKALATGVDWAFGLATTTGERSAGICGRITGNLESVVERVSA